MALMVGIELGLRDFHFGLEFVLQQVIEDQLFLVTLGLTANRIALIQSPGDELPASAVLV